MIERAFVHADVRCRNAVGVAAFVATFVTLSLYYLDDTRLLSVRPGSNSALLHSTAIESSSDRGYLVSGLKCHIRDVDPYDVEVRAFVKTVPYISCTKTPLLTYTTKGADHAYSELHLNATATKDYSPNGVTCCYSNVTRSTNAKKPDDVITISKCKPFNGSVNITNEFVIVKCATRNRHKEVYRNAHAVVNVRPEVRARLDTSKRTSKERPLSVLLVGIDSISRLNALRTMPKTTNYLRQQGWTELQGYNKIGDNTFPNLMAVLTGIDGPSSYTACLPTQLYHLDNCSFIWRAYRDAGYVTAYAEDESELSTFNYLKVGFVKPPTDYYLRPFILAAQRELKTVSRDSLKYCVGPVPAGERILNYAQDFAATFVNESSFGLFWANSFSHNNMNTPSAMDLVLTRFFQRLEQQGVTNSSMVVFFSDHGMRFGNMRQTKMGWFEERLPFLWISIPTWWAESHKEEAEALKINSRRLTTPYDLHMTLQHILVLSGARDAVVQSSGCSQCHSLLRPVDVNRACEDVAISPHWCTCTNFRPVDRTGEQVHQAARFVVTKIGDYVRDRGFEKKCARLSLNRVLIAQTGRSWDGNNLLYLLLVEALPGRGKFEATVSILANATEGFRLHSSISRLDYYGGSDNDEGREFSDYPSE